MSLRVFMPHPRVRGGPLRRCALNDDPPRWLDPIIGVETLPVASPMFRARQALKEFRAAVAREFAFLATDFGFAEERVQRPANEFSVWFVECYDARDR